MVCREFNFHSFLAKAMVKPPKKVPVPRSHRIKYQVNTDYVLFWSDNGGSVLEKAKFPDTVISAASNGPSVKSLVLMGQ